MLKKRRHKIQSSKPKLLICSSFYFPEKGAAPYRITAMAEMLEFEVTVITPLPNYPTGKIFKGTFGEIFGTKMINGVKIVRYWVFPTNSNSRITRMLSLVVSAFTAFVALFRHFFLERTYQVVIIQSPPLLSAFFYQLACNIFRQKTVINISDIWPSTAVDLGAMRRGSISWRVFKSMERYLYSHAEAFIAQSIESKDYLERQSKKPVQLFRNLTQKKEGLRSLSSENAPVKIIYAGLLGKAQGVLSIIEGIDWQSINTEIHIYGDGNQKNSIKSINKKYVFCHDSLPKEEIQELMLQFDFSLISLTNNIFGAFPSKIAAAVASQVPILFLGMGEGQKVVNQLGIGKTFNYADFGSISEFLKGYSKNRTCSSREFTNNLEKAITGEFCPKTNNEKLNIFLKKNFHKN